MYTPLLWSASVDTTSLLHGLQHADVKAQILRLLYHESNSHAPEQTSAADYLLELEIEN
jgi:hypothetical protein